MAIYKVRWKGKVLGEFSKEQIQADLRTSKISLFHQVFIDETWLTIKDFLDRKVELLPEEKIENEKGLNIAYFSTGLAFLSPYLMLISLFCSIYLFINKSKKNALIVSFLSIIMMILGLIFFNLIDELKK